MSGTATTVGRHRSPSAMPFGIALARFTAITLAWRRLPSAIPLAIALAWMAAVAAHVGGFPDHFHHDALVGEPGTINVLSFAGFAGLWTTMVAAMMLPSTVPLVRLFVGAS